MWTFHIGAKIDIQMKLQAYKILDLIKFKFIQKKKHKCYDIVTTAATIKRWIGKV